MFQILSYAILLFVNGIDTLYLNAETKEKNESEDHRAHLKLKHIIELCAQRNIFCRGDAKRLCAIRRVGKKIAYKDYENSCYLFMNNMCEQPGEEFYIVNTDTCENYLTARRTINNDTISNDKNVANNTKTETIHRVRGKKTRLRYKEPKYPVEYSFDGHLCPLSCPDVYQPICIFTNTNNGKYSKYFQYMNHCLGDIHYCSSPKEFMGPPDDPEDYDVVASELQWALCGSASYTKFAQFARHMSSLNHYGWLEGGDYRPSHILTEKERRPGYGR